MRTFAPLAIVALLSTPTPARAEAELTNAYLRLIVQDNGNWALYTTGGIDGDVELGQDNYKRLIYGTGNTAATILAVGNDRFAVGGAPTDPMVATAERIGLTWRTDSFEISRNFALARSTTSDPDTLRIETRVTNLGASSTVVGLMIGLDTMIGLNDGAPLYTNRGIIRTETMFSGREVPRSWQAFENDDVANPGLVAQGTLYGTDATLPDRFLMGFWPNGVAQDYDYVATGATIGNDTAVAMWWENRTLGAGETLEVVTYYGVGEGSTAAGNLSLNLTSPAVLNVVAGALTPNPFDLNLVVMNNHPFAATGVAATLTLPAGLRLVEGSTSTSLGSIATAATGLATWRVQATAPLSGSASYAMQVDVTATNDPDTYTVERAVEVPAIPADLWLVGDFDRDQDIDLADFGTLARNWQSAAPTMDGATGGDIAPSTGTVPDVTPTPDGSVEGGDLALFTELWTWWAFVR